VGNEVVHVSAERINAASLIVNVVRRMRQSMPLVVNCMKRQIISPEEVLAARFDDVVTVVAYR
jgi:hypothetical protein